MPRHSQIFAIFCFSESALPVAFVTALISACHCLLLQQLGLFSGIRPYQQPYPRQHKGNAEPLSHIQLHAFLESHLVFLQIFNQEPEEKDADQEESEKKSGPLFAHVLPVDAEEQKEGAR